MASNWIFALFTVAVGANAASTAGRIIGGTTTTIETWPFVVQVESTTTGLSWSQFCAANILNSRYVLSAAQCFDGALFSTSRRRLRGGTARRGSGGIVIGVNRVLNHPNYRSSTKQADISIVEQTAGWVWTTRIQPVNIVPQDFILTDNLPVVLAGWGATRASGLLGQSSSTLQEVTVKSVNRDWCAERYANTTSQMVDENMMCTGAEENGADSCSSDEGGPVYYVDVNDMVSLIGVISWRSTCGDSSIPSVNTRVSAYTNWIVINAI